MGTSLETTNDVSLAYVYLIVTKSLHNLRDVEQDGVLRRESIFQRTCRSFIVFEEEINTAQRVTYRRKGAQHFNSVLSGERMRRVHAAEVGQTGGGVGWGPAQDVAQLRRVCINGVPRHKELRQNK